MSPGRNPNQENPNATGIDPKTPGRGEQTSESQTGPRQSRTQRQPRRGAPRRGAPGAKGETQNKGPEPGGKPGEHKNQQTLRTPIGVTGELKFQNNSFCEWGADTSAPPRPEGESLRPFLYMSVK